MGRRRGEELARPEKNSETLALTLPAPYEALGESPVLIDVEREDLATCEAAIYRLRIAFWAAGKALQVIRDARLYRGTHSTFEDYVEERWQISRAQAYRLIGEWPLAERLSPIGDKNLNEGQVRELLRFAGKHGDEAAETVYRTVAEVDGVKVTAAVLKDVVSILPSDYFDPAEAVEQIRTYLASEHPPTSTETTATETFAAEAGRLRAILQRVVRQDLIRSAVHESPEEVKQTVAELRALLDEIEQKMT
ncbi:hypothetical protein [Streptosporangium sp. NPDC051022]|uniref:hypothetical protein n=1 Tax=Streptosporangium sp. NPDC051022 TaxID=3155752 RepID=UPI00343AC881